MKSKMHVAIAVIPAMIVVLSVVGCNKKADVSEKTFKVGFSNSSDSDFFNKIRRDEFERIAKTDLTISVIFTDANMDSSRQLDQIDNFIMQKVNAIVLQPVDGTGVVPGIEKANAAGIPVVMSGVDATGGEYIYVGTQYYDAGERQGKYMVEHLPQNAKIVYLIGIPGHAWSEERRRGFLDQIKTRSDLTVLAEQAGMSERAKGMQIMEDWIQSFPQIDAVVAANDEMALGALEALKGTNRLQGILIAGVDATKDACKAIKAGEMALSVLQSAPETAKQTFETVKRLQNGESVQKEIIIPHINVTKENVDQYL
jgi:inositol transport system substrate-binding protein